ncbi:MAG: hypothetical protein ACUVWP_08855 [bacterium]
MFRTYFTLILVITFFLLYWIGLENSGSLDNLFFIVGIFPTVVLISMLIATKSYLDSKNGRSMKFMKAVSGFPNKSFIVRTVLPLSIITIYLGVRFLFFTKYGTSRNWNGWVAFIFYLGMTIMILSYIKPIDFADKKLKGYFHAILIISKVILYPSAFLTIGLIIGGTFGGMGCNLAPVSQLDSFFSSRSFVPFDLLLLTITIIALKPKEK